MPDVLLGAGTYGMAFDRPSLCAKPGLALCPRVDVSNADPLKSPGGWATKYVEASSAAWGEMPRVLACSNAWANARTFANRLYGSFANAIMTTSSITGVTYGTWPCRGAGITMACFTAISVNEPWNGRSPLSHS